MSKKKAAAKSAKKAVRKLAKPAKARAKTAKKVTATATKAARSKSVVARKGSAPAVKEEVKPEQSLGRPLVTQEEKLYMLFHDDFQARQVFEFLRVATVKDLEEFSPHQIVHMMSKPLRMTVDRIRQRLAQYKRSLKDDEQFAAEFRQNDVKK